MRRQELTIADPDTDKVIASLRWQDGITEITAVPSEDLRAELEEIIRSGLVEWLAEGGDRIQRVTESHDALFLERLGDDLQRQFRLRPCLIQVTLLDIINNGETLDAASDVQHETERWEAGEEAVPGPWLGMTAQEYAAFRADPGKLAAILLAHKRGVAFEDVQAFCDPEQMAVAARNFPSDVRAAVLTALRSKGHL